MPCSIRRPSIIAAIRSRRSVALPLALALVGAAGPHAIAADAGSDVQVNLDVLESLRPTGNGSTGAVHLHPLKPRLKLTPAVVEKTGAARHKGTPQASAPVAADNAAAPRNDVAATPATESAGSNAPAAPAVPASPPPAATPAPAPASAPVKAETAPPSAAAPAAAPVQTAATPPAVKAPAPPAPVLFAAGSADLPNGAKPGLDALAQWLDANRQARIQIVAYASGSAEEANEARRVSLSRALVVRGYLAGRGIETTRMDVRALGNRSESGPADRVDVVMMTH